VEGTAVKKWHKRKNTAAQWSFTLRISHQNTPRVSLLSHTRYMPHPSHSITLTIVGEEYMVSITLTIVGEQYMVSWYTSM
jgi:hypothetical protein